MYDRKLVNHSLPVLGFYLAEMLGILPQVVVKASAQLRRSVSQQYATRTGNTLKRARRGSKAAPPVVM